MDALSNAVTGAAADREHRSVQTARLRRLGRREYVPVWQAMKDLTDRRDAEADHEIWVVEHLPVFTQGQAGKPEHLLMPGDIPVVQVDRGGQVTYHGPGQVVIYPLLDLRRLNLGVRDLVCRIEQAGIDALRSWGIAAHRLDSAPGVYVAGAKIMALGLRVRRGCTFHGLAFNVEMDLSPYQRINPCGYQGLPVTDLSRCDVPVSWHQASDMLLQQLAHQLGLRLAAAGAGMSDIPVSEEHPT
ncbi:MAG: lipoyl(octanoyl) transferase LipB [Aquimonas sp.]|nr:lipoyl(octanoyl) transferase LipB [Aquimonas sp.]